MRPLRILATIVLGFAVSPAHAAPFAYVTEALAGNVKVIDIANDRPVADVAVGRLPEAVAINAAGTRVYVVNAGEHTVSVIDTATNRVSATITVDGRPSAIAVNPAGTRVYVVSSDFPTADVVSVIDAATDLVVAKITVRNSTQPRGLLVSPDGTRLYLANSGSNGISVIDTTTHETVATIRLGTSPHAMAINADGSRIYATFPYRNLQLVVLDTSSYAVIQSTAVNLGSPEAIALNRAGTRAYVLDSGIDTDDGIGTIRVLDIASLAVMAKVTVGMYPKGIAIHPSGARIYVTNGGSDTVSVIDAGTHTVTAVIPVGRFPTSYGNFIGPAKAGAGNYQGLWWKPSESGWGVSIAHQGDILFATLFTYNENGDGIWLAMSDGAKTGPGTYSGSLHQSGGPPYNANPWNPAAVITIPVGSATLAFTDDDNGTLTYTYRGKTQSKSITRQRFASPVPTCVAGGTPQAVSNYQDLWWRHPPGSEPSWGLNIAHQGDIIFATLFIYDRDRLGLWLVMSHGARTGPNTYSGTLYVTGGPPYDAAPWNPAEVIVSPVGTATLEFSAADRGILSYSIGEFAQSQPITRQSFASPATVCH